MDLEKRTTAEKNANKKIHEVEIAGVQLKLKTSNSEEKVAELVALVNGQVETALNASQNRSIQNAAIIAALNFAEELLHVKDFTRSELDSLKTHAKSIISDLESAQQTQIDH